MLGLLSTKAVEPRTTLQASIHRASIRMAIALLQVQQVGPWNMQPSTGSTPGITSTHTMLLPSRGLGLLCHLEHHDIAHKNSCNASNLAHSSTSSSSTQKQESGPTLFFTRSYAHGLRSHSRPGSTSPLRPWQLVGRPPRSVYKASIPTTRCPGRCKNKLHGCLHQPWSRLEQSRIVRGLSPSRHQLAAPLLDIRFAHQPLQLWPHPELCDLRGARSFP
mmetsp:Transcript_21375/g.45714  ORF Transcript_21375/g.45714 Transcript_21375/m.45714 type:complete len:219 (-) Transcript_21375:918-1574(-)